MSEPDPLQPSLDRIWGKIDGFLDADDADDRGLPGGDAELGDLTAAPPDDRLVARAKAAWCTRPLHALEHSKGQRHWEGYALLELGVLAIDAVVERMELSDGADPDAIRALLAGTAALQQPQDVAEAHRDVADAVLSALLTPLEVTYGVADGGAYARKEWNEKLLAEIETYDGRFQLRASRAAVNVLVGALDLDDLESATAANEAALESLVRRGRLSLARRRAADARKLSKAYAEEIRELVAASRRSMASVSWDADLRPRLEQAYSHLGERVEAEVQMARRLEDMVDEVEDRASLATILDVIRDCLRRHRQLHGAVMGAQTTLLDQQAAQAFRAPAALRLVNLADDVLDPLLQAKSATATIAVERSFSSFTTARAPRVLGLGGLLERMLAPERDRVVGLGPEIDEAAVDDIDPAGRFGTASWKAAELILRPIDGPVRLSDLLSATSDPEARRLLALVATSAFDPELVARGLVASASGHVLGAGDFAGDDLHLQRLPEFREDEP